MFDSIHKTIISNTKEICMNKDVLSHNFSFQQIEINVVILTQLKEEQIGLIYYQDRKRTRLPMQYM